MTEYTEAMKDILSTEMSDSVKLRLVRVLIAEQDMSDMADLADRAVAAESDDESMFNPTKWTTTLSPAELRTAKENLELVSRADKLLVKWQGILDDWKDMHPSINRAVWAESAINIWSRVISDLKGIVQ
jgi:hypothetical protein